MPATSNTPRSRLLQAALILGRFTAVELMQRADVRIDTATGVMSEWLDSGFVAVAGAVGTEGRVVYRVEALDAPGRVAPELNLWRAMRGLMTFSATDVRLHANTPAVTVSERTARDYCRALMTAGYLRVVTPAGAGREAVYRLIRNTGPGAPAVRRVQTLIDPNLGGAVWAAVPAVVVPEPSPPSPLAQRFKALRGNASQAEFAARVGITRTVLANHESDRSIPDAAEMARIAVAAGADPNWFWLAEAGS